eukprot:Tbor_TRINITY_DN6096_c0_g3::TRINITY_DN6096_c0_g3_i3::g.11597::m.11597
MRKSFGSQSGNAFGLKTIMVLMVYLLPLESSYATSITDKGGEYAVKGDGWQRKGGTEGPDNVKKVMVVEANKVRKTAMESGEVLPENKSEKMMTSPFQEGTVDGVKKKMNFTRSTVKFQVGEFNNITLDGVAWVPTQQPENPNEKFPVVIFPNSWATANNQYDKISPMLAEKGYVIIAYETRGWFGSGAEVNVAGAKDRADASKVIDFLLSDERVKEWNINTSAVAFAGISYGGGISQMMAGYDVRVKTVVSMSGWGDILKALYGYESVSSGTIGFLIDSGDLLGRVPGYLKDMSVYLRNHINLDKVEAFAKERSPSSFIDAINARNRNGYRVSVFMSVNMGDDFFAPQHSIEFWQQLDVPKMLLVNQGDHAEVETFGLFETGNYIWDKVGAWLDHELKGIDNGILTDPVKEPQVRVQAGDSVYSFDYISFPKGWPRTTTNSTPTARNPKLRDNVVGGGPIGSFIVEYALSARGGASGTQYGGLNLISSPRNRNPFTSLHSRKRYNDDPSLNTISYSTYPGIGSTFLLSSSSSGEGYPIPTYLNTVPNTTAILYTTPPLENHVLYSKRNLRPSPRDNKSRVATGEDPISSAEADTNITICGSPEIRNFTFTPFAVWPEDKKRSFSDRWQLYAFLYDQYPTKHKDGYGKGLLISNGAFSHNTGNNYRDWKDNVHIWQRDDGSTAVTIKSFVMRTVCRRIPAGHRLVLGFALAYRGYYLPSFPRNEGSEKSVGSTQPIRSSIPSLNNPPPLLSTSHLEVEVHYDTGSVIRFPFV